MTSPAVGAPSPPQARVTSSAATSVPPFDRLPAGRAPTTVPYAIGTHVHYQGRVFHLARELTGFWPPAPSQLELRKVAATRGVVVTAYLNANGYGEIARFSASLPYRRVGGDEGAFGYDVTLGGLVAAEPLGDVVRALDGRRYAAFPRRGETCDYVAVIPEAVGYSVLERETRQCPVNNNAAPDVVSLWYPGAKPRPMPSTMEAVGRWGVGWLGKHVTPDCWEIVPTTAPLTLGRRVCSMTRPLVNATGRWVVVVQSGRVRAISRLRAATNLAMALPAFPGWKAGVRQAIPATWETDDSFLVTARFDRALALVRCSASTGRCSRVVRATVAPGVSKIVTER